MNERIDILLTSAKIASRNNPWANLATHSISMAYNISMIGRYGYQLVEARADNGHVSQEYYHSIQRERIKHTVLAGIDIFGLLLSAINSQNK